ncbi:MAG: hypothetical protein ACO3ND_08260 [Opitutales bacterium]
MIAQAQSEFALRGPMPEMPPGLLASPWTWVAVILLTASVWGVVRLLRARPGKADPAGEALREIESAAAQPPERALALVAAALRRYVAAVEPAAPAGLSTGELEARLGAAPVFLPARGPLIAALRASDLARFAGGHADPTLVAAAAREAIVRAEAARGAFARSA